MGYLEESMRIKDDQGRPLKNPFSSLQSNSYRKETFIFQSVLGVLFFWPR